MSKLALHAKSGATTASQKVLKMSQAAAFTKLRHLMAGLLDTLCITPEDSTAKSRHEMTLFVNRDSYLLPAQKIHCILLFISNVAYADCLCGLVGELTNPNGPDIDAEQLEGIRNYYTKLLEIPV